MPHHRLCVGTRRQKQLSRGRPLVFGFDGEVLPRSGSHGPLFRSHASDPAPLWGIAVRGIC